MSRETDIAWAAGLFEGEGCISKGAQPHHIKLILRMTDKDVVERFRDLMGGTIYERDLPPPRKRIWSWYANGSEAATVLTRLMPHFGNRRRIRAMQMLAAFDGHVASVTVERECAHCGRGFCPPYSARSIEQKFCSQRCRTLANGRGWKVAV